MLANRSSAAELSRHLTPLGSDGESRAGWQEMADLGSSPRTVLEELARLHTVNIVLPMETGQELRLRCVIEPEKATEILLERLGLRLPKRLRLPPAVVEM